MDLGKEKTSRRAFKKQKVRILPYVLFLPTLVGSAVFGFYPFFKTILSSFSFTTEYGEWIGWAGTAFWNMMFQNEEFWKILRTTLVFAVMNFTLTFCLAMFLALLSVKRSKYGRIYQTLFALPMAIASATATASWRFILRTDGGLLNTLLGTEINWLVDERTALWVVAAVTAWTHVASSYLFLLAGFRGVSEDVQEAAIVDGANAFTRAVKIVIPMASPQIFFVLFLNIITALKTFTQVKLLTAGGPAGSTTTLMYEVYVRAIENGEYEYACCHAIVLFLLIFLATRIQFLFEKKMVHYQ